MFDGIFSAAFTRRVECQVESVEVTLIVFDEVQLCERALTSLKYFCEDAPDYHIIVAGSLLGVALNRAKFSFPGGRASEFENAIFTFVQLMFSDKKV